MARLAPRVPELAEILCESCGYTLSGLPPDGRCPECGKPIAESVGDNRLLPPWETSTSKLHGFLNTTTELIFHPTIFYRTLAVRGPLESARRFAHIHWLISGSLFALAAATHAFWYRYLLTSPQPWIRDPSSLGAFALTVPCLAIVTYFFLDLITRLAARLTTWEATYRGIRLPREIVLRGMYYHAAHYLPVALLAVITIVGHQLLLLVTTGPSDQYLYVLCGQVIISAIYLFQTYWIGMRNMMYANR